MKQHLSRIIYMHFVKNCLFISHKHYKHQLSVNFHVTIEFGEKRKKARKLEKI